MRPPAASTNRRAQRRDAGQPLQKVERGPLADQQRARRAADLGDLRRRAAQRSPSRLARDAPHAGLELPERLERDVEPGEHAVGFHQEHAARASAPARTVASVVTSPPPHVFVERAADDVAVERRVERLHGRLQRFGLRTAAS